MQMIEVSKLKSHPRNHEFFDDITGERWEDFIKSIVRRGVIEAIVATEDSTTHELIIVSGHQRVKACNEIGILEVPCRIVHYPEFDEQTGTPKEDMILEDLICTNIMQRGVGNVNPMKMAKCISELKRIYNIKKGNNQNSKSNNLTSEQLYQNIGLTKQQINNYEQLTNLIPELQSLVETGALKSTTAYKIWAKMPQEEQEKFFNEIGRDKVKEMTQKETARIIQEKQQLEETNKQLEKSYNELSQKYNQEKNKPIQTETVEIDNTDYSIINKNKELEKQLNQLVDEKNKLGIKLQLMANKADAYEQDSLDYKKMKEEIEYLTKQKDDLGRQLTSITSISSLVVDIDHLIKEKLAPVKYSKALLEAKDDEIVLRNLTEIVEIVEQWCYEMKQEIPNKINYVEVMQ